LALRILFVLLLLLAAGCSRAVPSAPAPPAPPVVVLERVDVASGAVHLEWRVRGGRGVIFDVQRRHAEQAWKTRARLQPDAAGLLTLDDAAVTPGEPYSYRVKLPAGDEPAYAGDVTVDVPRP